MTTSLAQLIDSVKAANGWSDPDLVRNAERRGHTLTKSNISRYRNEDPLISIKGTVIESIAAGLHVSTAQVAVAAVESMGIALPSYDVPTVEQAIRLDTRLAARDRTILLATLSGLRENGASDAASHPSAPAPVDPPAAPGTQGAEVQKSPPDHVAGVDSGSDPEGQAADEARPNVWRDKPAAPTDLHARRRPPADPDQYRKVARTRDPRFQPQDPDAYDNTIGEEADPEGPEGGA